MLNDGFGGGWHISENQCDINRETVQTLFIYCDILEHVVVGDGMASLLRMVGMKHKQSHGKMHETPHVILYVPLQKKQFDTIEINITFYFRLYRIVSFVDSHRRQCGGGGGRRRRRRQHFNDIFA